MRLFQYILIFCAGGLATFAFMKWGGIDRRVHQNTAPVQAAVGPVAHVSGEDRSKRWPEIFSRLGIINGDLITAANGHSEPNRIFPALIGGFEKGKVCVQFIRTGKELETCYERNEKREIVRDTLVPKPASAEASGDGNTPMIDMAEILRNTDTSKLKEGYVPYLKDGKFLGFVKAQDAPPSNPTKVDSARYWTAWSPSINDQ